MKSLVQIRELTQHFFKLPILLCVIAFCTACDPTNRVVWSPDGQHLAVLGGDGIHLGDSSGTLTPPLVNSAELVAWFPDSHRLLVGRHKETDDWKQLAEVLGPEDVKTVLAEAGKVRSSILSFKGSWEDFDKGDTLSDLRFGPEDVIYLKTHNNEELLKKMGQKWKEVETMKAGIWYLQIYDVSEHNLAAGPIIYKSTRHIEDLRISGNGNFVALTESTKIEGGSTYRLRLLPISGAKIKTVTELASKYPDWTADSRGLVYIESLARPINNDYPCPGVLRKLTFQTPAPLTETGNTNDLAEVVFRSNDRVRCLKDGRILFSCPEVSLPASSKDIKWVQNLFGIDSSRQSTVMRMTPSSVDSQIGDRPEYFEPSPDGSKVSIPSNSGSVSILSLAEGTVMNSMRPKEDKGLAFIPQWRSDNELCLAAPNINSNDNSLSVILWSILPETQKRLSSSWTQATLKGLLR